MCHLVPGDISYLHSFHPAPSSQKRKYPSHCEQHLPKLQLDRRSSWCDSGGRHPTIHQSIFWKRHICRWVFLLFGWWRLQPEGCSNLTWSCSVPGMELCELDPVPCEAATTSCSSAIGRPNCSCLPGFVPSNYSTTSCRGKTTGPLGRTTTDGFHCNSVICKEQTKLFLIVLYLLDIYFHVTAN